MTTLEKYFRLPNGYHTLGWHFLPDNRETRYSSKPVRSGTVLTVAPPLKLCERGLHYSPRAIDAIGYAPGQIVCVVALGGAHLTAADKGCAERRKCLAIADATRTLHEFAIWCARRALLVGRKAGRKPDKRSWTALRVKRAWLAGKATNEQLSAAQAAASAAASDAARDAASDAASDAAWAAAQAAAWAAASAAAWDAAWAAARTAARAAASDAAWAAAWDAAWAAARTAAWDAARDAQNTQLERMMLRLLKGGAK